MKFIHLSDLHIGQSNNQQKAGLIVDWIIQNRDVHGADLVVITGDVVDDGKLWQFELARDLIDRLRAEEYQVLAAPGNHDYGPSGIMESLESQAQFSQLINGIREYPALFLTKGQAFVILDSMQEEMRSREIVGAQGHLGLEQLQKLDLLLDDLADNPAVENIVLVMHHHPFDYLFYHGLRDHADLKGVVSRRPDKPPRVNALLFGHKHIDHRFNDPDENMEELYGIDLIFASGQSVERKEDGKMVLPVIDLEEKSIKRFKIE